jgi:hypothetical protein
MFVGISNKNKLDHRKKNYTSTFKTLGQRNNYEISICMTFEKNKITNMEKKVKT